MTDWRSIETAPKVAGELLLLWDSDVNHPEIASWSDNHQCWVIGYSNFDPEPGADIVGCTVYLPTHWALAPAPPKG